MDAIIQSIGRDTSKDISFTLPRADVEEAVRVLEEQKGALHFDHLTVEDKIAKVSIVGAGMMTTPGVAAKMFEALYDANINIQMINTSEIRVSVLIDEEDCRVSAPDWTRLPCSHDIFWPAPRCGCGVPGPPGWPAPAFHHR